MSATVFDIAKKATVSIATVSRVLNNTQNVSRERKQRVLAAMNELNFQPNRLARKIARDQKNQQTSQIAMMLINRSDRVMHTAYMMQYIHGVQQEIAAMGRKCIFITWNETSDSEAPPHVLLDGEIGGMIVKGLPHTEIGKQWLRRYPRIILTPPAALPDCDCVMVDYEEGTYDCVAHLASLGHRRIAFMDMQRFHAKLLGYRRAIEELGLDVDEGLIQTRASSLDDALMESDLNLAIENLWLLPKPPTAILSNDYFCGAIYKALAKRGLKVPDDVSVIGYDNDTSLCDTLTPKLTSVDIEAVELGKLAVKQLLDRIQNPQERYRKTCVRGKIVERESVRKI